MRERKLINAEVVLDVDAVRRGLKLSVDIPLMNSYDVQSHFNLAMTFLASQFDPLQYLQNLLRPSTGVVLSGSPTKGSRDIPCGTTWGMTLMRVVDAL